MLFLITFKKSWTNIFRPISLLASSPPQRLYRDHEPTFSPSCSTPYNITSPLTSHAQSIQYQTICIKNISWFEPHCTSCTQAVHTHEFYMHPGILVTGASDQHAVPTVGRRRRAKPIQVSAPGGLKTAWTPPSPPHTIPTPQPPNHRRTKPVQGPYRKRKQMGAPLSHRRGDRKNTCPPLRKRFRNPTINSHKYYFK